MPHGRAPHPRLLPAPNTGEGASTGPALHVLSQNSLVPALTVVPALQGKMVSFCSHSELFTAVQMAQFRSNTLVVCEWDLKGVGPLSPGSNRDPVLVTSLGCQPLPWVFPAMWSQSPGSKLSDLSYYREQKQGPFLGPKSLLQAALGPELGGAWGLLSPQASFEPRSCSWRWDSLGLCLASPCPASAC